MHTPNTNFTCFLMNFNFPSTNPPPLPCTSNPGQFLSPVWGTSSVGGCGYGQTGGQDVSLIITQSDLLPAPDSLPPAPDTSSTDGGLEGMEGPKGGGGDLWTETHRQQLQQGNVSDPPADRHDAVVRELAHPASAFPVCSPSSSSASFPTSALAALLSLSCCLPPCVCVCL